MNTNTGGPAFPAGAHFGMTLRDYFAGQALVAVSAMYCNPDAMERKIAITAYGIADAMLAAREAKQ